MGKLSLRELFIDSSAIIGLIKGKALRRYQGIRVFPVDRLKLSFWKLKKLLPQAKVSEPEVVL